MKKVIISFFLFFAFLIFCTAQASTKIEVLKVYDGDTILAKIDDNIQQNQPREYNLPTQ